MAMVESLRGLAQGMTCDKCGDSLIAPVWVEYLIKERLGLNLWSCMSCGNRFETEAVAPIGAKSKIGRKALRGVLFVAVGGINGPDCQAMGATT